MISQLELIVFRILALNILGRGVTLPKTNIAPENRPFQKESIPFNHQFSGAMLVSVGLKFEHKLCFVFVVAVGVVWVADPSSSWALAGNLCTPSVLTTLPGISRSMLIQLRKVLVFIGTRVWNWS